MSVAAICGACAVLTAVCCYMSCLRQASAPPRVATLAPTPPPRCSAMQCAPTLVAVRAGAKRRTRVFGTLAVTLAPQCLATLKGSPYYAICTAQISVQPRTSAVILATTDFASQALQPAQAWTTRASSDVTLLNTSHVDSATVHYALALKPMQPPLSALAAAACSVACCAVFPRAYA